MFTLCITSPSQLIQLVVLYLTSILFFLVNTHCHADHITGTGILKTKTKCRSLISEQSGAQADILLNDGDKIQYGDMVKKKLSSTLSQMI